MKKDLTLVEIEARFDEINASLPDELTADELASLADAEAIDDGTAIDLEDYKTQREYSGKLLLRIPRELHKALATTAKDNGVSLNQYVLYKLAK